MHYAAPRGPRGGYRPRKLGVQLPPHHQVSTTVFPPLSVASTSASHTSINYQPWERRTPMDVGHPVTLGSGASASSSLEHPSIRSHIAGGRIVDPVSASEVCIETQMKLETRRSSLSVASSSTKSGLSSSLGHQHPRSPPTDLNISELTSEYQTAAIEKSMAQQPKMSEVNFRGQKIIIPNEEIAAVLVRIEGISKSDNASVETYEELLVELRDAIQSVRDTIAKADQMQNVKQKSAALLSYLLYLRLKVTNSRTELILKEKTLTKDQIRLIEVILHNLMEMKSISGLENDEDFILEVDNEITAYKSFRCRHLADVYKSSKKWSEALILYNQAVEYFKQAKRAGTLEPKLVKRMDAVSEYCKTTTIECRAQIVLDEFGDKEDEDSALKLKRPKEPLVNRLNEFVLDESLVSGEPNVADFPPDFRPVPCKPLFFDLAVNHVKPPAALEAKAGLTQKRGGGEDGAKGITGFVKGLWGWGSK